MLRKTPENWTLELSCGDCNGLERWFKVDLEYITVSVVSDYLGYSEAVYWAICPFCGQLMEIPARKIPKRFRKILLEKYNFIVY